MVRFTLLTPTLVRLEYSPTGTFVDQPSVVVINRNWPPVPAKQYEEKGYCCLDGERLRIRYRKNSGPFGPENLLVCYRHGDQWRTWRPGEQDPHNLGGTLHSLDGVSESSLPPLPAGILSRSGYYLLQDEHHALLTADGWHTPRKEPTAQYWYFFGYGDDYALALREYAQLTGPVPMLPRWAFGAWYSRYWPYSDRELREVVTRFKRESLPLAVLVIDVDWHLHGWEGYDWNPELFPRPEEFLAWVHAQGLKVTLNNHPGLLPPEESAYQEVVARLGTGHIGPDGSFVFNLALREHAEVFMDLLHKPFHGQGVDFWWIDGAAASAPGLNGQMWTNKVYYDKTETYTGKRALIFSRYGGHGSHRYPISFSGDTYSDWGVLRYEIAFTATAGNVLIPYWTHDIGGFFGNKLDDELYVRWVQFGALSPFLRLHSDHGIREPWRYSRAAQRIVRAFFHLRSRLLPCIYTYARQVHEHALPLCRPLYLEWPHIEEAYAYRHQYLFGRELLVAPIDQPGEFGVATKEVYFPPGTWVDMFTGSRIRGPKVAVWRSPLAQMPLFARAGAIVPQASLDMPGEVLVVDVYSGANGEFELYEDDGETLAYRDGAYRTTPIRYSMAAGRHCVEVGPARGTYRGAPAKRAYLIRLLSLPRPKVVELDGQPLPRVKSKKALSASNGAWCYGQAGHCVEVKTSVRDSSAPVRVAVHTDADAAYLDLLAAAEQQVQLLTDLREAARQVAARGPLAAKLDALFRRAEHHRLQAGKGALTTVRLGEAVAAMEQELRALANEIASEAPVQSRRQLLQALFGLVACTRIGEMHGDEAILPIICTFASGELAPRLQVTSILSASREWLQGLQGPASVSGELAPGGVFTAKFLLVAPSRFPVDRITFQVDNRLQWNGQEFRHPASFELPATFLQAYHLIGPFDNADHQALDRVDPPENEINLAGCYPGKFGPVRWQKWQWRPPRRSTGSVFINLRNTIYSGHDVAAYAVTDLHSPQDMEVLFALGSTGGYRLWVNGQLVHVHRQQRSAMPGQDKVLVRLRAGRNRVLIKSVHTGGSWGFFLEVTDLGGKPVPHLVNAYVE
ncbi:MAG: DUF5110 domain-containing protein [Calditrichaeota bacterium]|nr:DUF5110 domain-containing protein [Calditrichota bacterium]